MMLIGIIYFSLSANPILCTLDGSIIEQPGGSVAEEEPDQYLEFLGPNEVVVMDGKAIRTGFSTLLYTGELAASDDKTTQKTDVIVKYSLNCYRGRVQSVLHPLLRETVYIHHLEGRGLTPPNFFLSEPYDLIPRRDHRTSFDISDSDFVKCALSGASVRFMVTEKRGSSVASLMKTYGRLPLVHAAAIGVLIIQKLEKLHSLGIVHGDIHPGNLIFSNFRRRRSSMWLGMKSC
jgi:hypothetical protein